MKKLLTVLAVLFVVGLAGCSGGQESETKLRVTSHESGEITVCVFEEYADGSKDSSCDLFVIDNSELEEQIADLQEQIDQLQE